MQTKEQAPSVTLEASFTWDRTLPVWRINVLNASGKCVHSVENVSRDEAESLAIKWATEHGFHREATP
jgi:hypothetical protein